VSALPAFRVDAVTSAGRNVQPPARLTGEGMLLDLLGVTAFELARVRRASATSALVVRLLLRDAFAVGEVLPGPVGPRVAEGVALNCINRPRILESSYPRIA
jgi:hypothetical protein